MDITSLPQELTTLASSGNAVVQLALSADGRLSALIHFTTPAGVHYAIGLSPQECGRLADDFGTLCDASPQQFETWRLELEYGT